jgi:hypothetical protein
MPHILHEISFGSDFSSDFAAVVAAGAGAEGAFVAAGGSAHPVQIAEANVNASAP